MQAWRNNSNGGEPLPGRRRERIHRIHAEGALRGPTARGNHGVPLAVVDHSRAHGPHVTVRPTRAEGEVELAADDLNNHCTVDDLNNRSD